MFFTFTIGAKTNIRILKSVPFSIMDTWHKHLVVAVDTQKHFCCLASLKMKYKLLKIIFELFILLLTIDHVMSQCGIRWRGTCDTKSNARSRTSYGWSKWKNKACNFTFEVIYHLLLYQKQYNILFFPYNLPYLLA